MEKGLAYRASVNSAFTPSSCRSPSPRLECKGAYTANVTVKLANLPAGLKAYEPFDKINLSVTRHTSVIVDGWPASKPEQVQSHINTPILVPATELAHIAPVVDVAIAAVEFDRVPKTQLGKLDFQV